MSKEEPTCVCGEHSGIVKDSESNQREHKQMQIGIKTNSDRIDGMKNSFLIILCTSVLQLLGIITILAIALKGN